MIKYLKLFFSITFFFTGLCAWSNEVVTYTKAVRPLIFEKICSACHNGSSTIPNWLDYSIALNKAANIYDRVVVKREMPPPTSGLVLTEAEISLIEEWVDSGSPL